jgi:signal peptidase
VEAPVMETAKKRGGSAPLRRAGRFLGNTLFACTLLVLVALIFSLAASMISGGPPAVFGHQMYIVLSGSMSPSFGAGSLAFVRPRPPEAIKEGDIITYRGLGEGEKLVSHRVVAVNEAGGVITFTTKGDANDTVDPNPVKGENLVGKVVLAIPYLGYIMEFARTKQGLLVLVVIPTSALLLWEIAGIYKHMRAQRKKRAVPGESAGEIES